jgi:hypothetical protein
MSGDIPTEVRAGKRNMTKLISVSRVADPPRPSIQAVPSTVAVTGDRFTGQSRWKISDARAIRIQRASVKKSIRLGTTSLHTVLVSSERAVAGATVEELLRAVPWIGPVRSRRLLRRCHIEESARVSEVQPRALASLCALLPK